MSNTLTNKTPANTYKDLLRVDGTNDGIDVSAMRQFVAGDGTTAPIWVSQEQVEIDFGEGEANKPLLKSARHVFYEPDDDVTTSNLVIDLNAGNVQKFVLGTNISNLIFSDVPSDGIAFELVLIFKQDSTGGRTLSWPSTFKWPNASAPTVTATASKTDIFRVVTFDGGLTWFGSTYGQNYS